MKRRLLFISSFLVLLMNVAGQNISWKQELKKIPTADAQLNFLLTKSDELGFDPEAEEILNTALKIAGEQKNDTFTARALHGLGWIYLQSGRVKEATASFQKAKVLFLKERSFNRVAQVIYSQSSLLQQEHLPDSILSMIDHNQWVIRQAGKPARMRIELMYANAYMMLNRNAEAEAAYRKMLPELQEMKDTDMVISICMNIASLQNSFDSSMVWYRQVLDYAKLADHDMYTRLLTHIGFQYSQRDDKLRDSALYYFKEAEKQLGSITDHYTKAMLYNMLGDYFFERNENLIALTYFRKSMNEALMTGSPQPTVYHNMGLVYLNLRNQDSVQHYLTLFKTAVKNSSDDYELMLYHQLSAMHGKMGKDSCSLQVLKDYDQAIAYAVKLNDSRHGINMLVAGVMQCLLQPGIKNSEVRSIAQSLLGHCRFFYHQAKAEDKLLSFSEFLEYYADLEATYGNRDTALMLYKELTGVYSSMNKSKYMEGLDEAMVKYKADLKDAEISILKEQEKADSLRMNLVLLGLAAIVLVAILTFILYRRENKNRQKLDERNNKVEELLREVHHRVKNNLQIVSSFISIQMDKVIDKEATQALKDTSSRIMALAGLHHSLYQQDDLAHIQLDDYIRKLCQDIAFTMKSNDIKIECDLESLQLDMDQAIPIGLALNELITNSLKHAFDEGYAEGRISVSLHHREKWELVVKDNGKGLPADLSRLGSQSIGIRLVQNLVQKQVKGLFTYSNDGGALFKIEFTPMAA